MGQSLEHIMTAAREAKDTARAAASALWKRSSAGQEMARLLADGHLPGEPCELAFAFSFEEGEADAAVRSLTNAGFKVADRSNVARGFLTVTTPATLGSYTIARTAARLRRVGQRHGGHAEVIGLVGEAPRTIELTGPSRAVGARARSVA